MTKHNITKIHWTKPTKPWHSIPNKMLYTKNYAKYWFRWAKKRNWDRTDFCTWATPEKNLERVENSSSWGKSTFTYPQNYTDGREMLGIHSVFLSFPLSPSFLLFYMLHFSSEAQPLRLGILERFKLNLSSYSTRLCKHKPGWERKSTNVSIGWCM